MPHLNCFISKEKWEQITSINCEDYTPLSYEIHVPRTAYFVDNTIKWKTCGLIDQINTIHFSNDLSDGTKKEIIESIQKGGFRLYQIFSNLKK